MHNFPQYLSYTILKYNIIQYNITKYKVVSCNMQNIVYNIRRSFCDTN